MSSKKTTGTAALKMLVDAKIPHHIHSFESGKDHFGEEAASHLTEELGISAEQIFKTLVIDLTAGKGPKRQLAVCCVPVTTTLSLKKAAVAHGVSKVSMADPKDAQRSSGYIPGGISPIGQKTKLPTVIDESAKQFDKVYVSGGKRGLDIELIPNDLAAAVDGKFADVKA